MNNWRMSNKVVGALRIYACSFNQSGHVTGDMAALIEETDNLPLSNFDYWEHTLRAAWASALAEFKLPKWKNWLKPHRQMTWLDVINSDGYLRERALRALQGPAPNRFFFALALRRLNDWVPEVRQAARESLPELARASKPEHVVDALSIMFARWDTWGRIEQADKAVLLQIANEPHIAQSFREKLMRSATGSMPQLLGQLGRTPILDQALDAIAASAVQPAVRAKAYRSLFEQRITWQEGWRWVWTDIRYCQGHWEAMLASRKLSVDLPIVKLIEQSAQDPSPLVRRLAAQMLIQNLTKLGAAADGFAEQLAQDPSNAVAERGQFALRKLDEIENAR